MGKSARELGSALFLFGMVFLVRLYGWARGSGRYSAKLDEVCKMADISGIRKITGKTADKIKKRHINRENGRYITKWQITFSV